MENLNEQPIVRIKPEEGERFLPNDFYDILAHRYFPVLSLTYMASIVGMALKMSGPEAGFIYYFLEDPYVYRMGYWVAAWVSIPAILWILIKSTFHVKKTADLWYKATATLMVLTLLVSLFLFPTGDFGFEIRLFMVATIPIFVAQYFFFVRDGLPASTAWPLTLTGITFAVYGLIL